MPLLKRPSEAPEFSLLVLLQSQSIALLTSSVEANGSLTVDGAGND